jgi:SagB-type dehydrogenase family enzyme
VYAAGCATTVKEEAGVAGHLPQELSEPKTAGGMSLDEALAKRRSKRSFESRPLTEVQVAQLLWAAQGITDKTRGFRTAPSAGAIYPLEIYVLQGGTLRHYLPSSNSLEQIATGIDASELAEAASGQVSVSQAPTVFVMTGSFEKTAGKYADRAERYVYMEAGHAAQNLLLEATALGLGAVPVGAIDDARVKSILKLPGEQEPLYLIPVGYPAAGNQ